MVLISSFPKPWVKHPGNFLPLRFEELTSLTVLTPIQEEFMRWYERSEHAGMFKILKMEASRILPFYGP